DGKKPARFMSYSSEPMLWTLGMSLIEDRGQEPFKNLPPKPAFTEGPKGDDPYTRRLRRLAAEAKKRRSGRIHTPYDEQDLLATPRGTRTKFLVDRAIGSEASGITQVMIQFAPGKTQSLHRHPGEARLVRVHMFDSVLETMRALMDPMVLFEEAEDTLLSMQEVSQIEWPDDKRPES